MQHRAEQEPWQQSALAERQIARRCDGAEASVGIHVKVGFFLSFFFLADYLLPLQCLLSRSKCVLDNGVQGHTDITASPAAHAITTFALTCATTCC